MVTVGSMASKASIDSALACQRRLHQSVGFDTHRRWAPVRPLGRGTFGDVYLFRTQLEYVPDTYVYVAVKRIRSVYDNPIHMHRALRELMILHHLRGHPNIISLLDIDLVPRSSSQYPGLYCYSESMDCDLSSILRDPEGGLTPLHVPWLSYQLLCGLSYIHSANAVHRDLKPSNILISRKGALKICDFGLARGLVKGCKDQSRYTDYVTTRWYRAPEIILKVDHYHSGLDLWSVGCIIAELVLRRPLFRGTCAADQLSKIFELQGRPPSEWAEAVKSAGLLADIATYRPHPRSQDVFPVTIDRHLMNMISGFLVYKPDLRLSAFKALQSVYFDDVRDMTWSLMCPGDVDVTYEDHEVSMLYARLSHEVGKVKRCLRSGQSID